MSDRMEVMKTLMKKNVFLIVGLAIATASLLASWWIQQSDVLKVDTMDSLAVSGSLSAVAVVFATFVGLGLASRRN
jgi:hypothetical protein